MNGKQAALMAPTSILAEQHYRGISAAFERMPAELMPREGKPVIALLTGSITQFGARSDLSRAGGRLD